MLKFIVHFTVNLFCRNDQTLIKVPRPVIDVDQTAQLFRAFNRHGKPLGFQLKYRDPSITNTNPKS